MIDYTSLKIVKVMLYLSSLRSAAPDKALGTSKLMLHAKFQQREATLVSDLSKFEPKLTLFEFGKADLAFPSMSRLRQMMLW